MNLAPYVNSPPYSWMDTQNWQNIDKPRKHSHAACRSLKKTSKSINFCLFSSKEFSLSWVAVTKSTQNHAKYTNLNYGRTRGEEGDIYHSSLNMQHLRRPLTHHARLTTAVFERWRTAWVVPSYRWSSTRGHSSYIIIFLHFYLSYAHLPVCRTTFNLSFKRIHINRILYKCSLRAGAPYPKWTTLT